MRPSVDVVVPFRGDRAGLGDLTARLRALELREHDTLMVVDNTPGAPREGTLHAPQVPTPGFARNRGAAQGGSEWLVFIDADTAPAPDLVDRYFDEAPRERTALLAGSVVDEEVPPDAPAAARYAHLRGLMNQDNTLGWGEWAFAQMANAACRREAFEAVGGFREDIRAAEDADLAYRLRAAGWEIERRDSARVVHLSRPSMPALARQLMVHGAGGAWLDRHYPGSVPRKRWPGLLWWCARAAAAGVLEAARTRDRDPAILGLLGPLENVSYELGRLRGNDVTRP